VAEPKFGKEKGPRTGGPEALLDCGDLRIALPGIIVKALLSHDRLFGEQVSIA